MTTADPETIRAELIEIIVSEGMINREKLVPEATLEAIGMASYDMVMVLMEIEEKFGTYITVDTQLSEVKTLEELLDVLVARVQSGRSDPKPDPSTPVTGLKAQ